MTQSPPHLHGLSLASQYGSFDAHLLHYADAYNYPSCISGFRGARDGADRMKGAGTAGIVGFGRGGGSAPAQVRSVADGARAQGARRLPGAKP